MKNLLLVLISSSTSLIFCHSSFAVLDDGFAIPRNQSKKSLSKVTKNNESPRSLASKNDKMISNSIKHNKSILLNSIRSVKKSLGAVPLYIQNNWNSLSKDQKEIVYSYHNEDPFAKVNKEHFIKTSKPKDIYEHDTAYGFDSTQQSNLDALRSDINEETNKELPNETKVLIEVLASMEKDL